MSGVEAPIVNITATPGTDITADLNLAVHSLGSSGGVVRIPPATYKAPTGIPVYTPVTFEGGGTKEYFGQPGGTQLETKPGGSNVFTFIGPGSRGGGVRKMSFDGMMFDAPSKFPDAYFAISVNNALGAVCLEDISLHRLRYGIRVLESGRTKVRRIFGDPTDIGVYITKSLDVPRVEDVHFWPYNNAFDRANPAPPGHPVYEMARHRQEKGVGVILGGNDGGWMNDLFTYGYHCNTYLQPNDNGTSRHVHIGRMYADFTRVGLAVHQTNAFVHVGMLTAQGQRYCINPQRPSSDYDPGEETETDGSSHGWGFPVHLGNTFNATVLIDNLIGERLPYGLTRIDGGTYNRIDVKMAYALDIGRRMSPTSRAEVFSFSDPSAGFVSVQGHLEIDSFTGQTPVWSHTADRVIKTPQSTVAAGTLIY